MAISDKTEKSEALVEHPALSQMGATFAERKAAREAVEKPESDKAEKAVQAAENKAVKKTSRKS